MPPKITIVTVTYNCIGSLPDTMESVLSQTYPNMEYIIIDGGSKDGTVNYVKKHSQLLSYWVSEPDKGIFDAMNKGIEHATGDWINFMNAGDRFASPNVLDKIFSREINSSVGCIYGHTLNVSRDGRMYKDKNKPFHTNSHYFRAMGINHQSVFVRTQLARKFPFDLTFKIAADYSMLNKIFLKGYSFLEIPHVVSEVDVTGFSAQNRRQQRLEEARISGCEGDFRFRIWTNYKSLRAWFKNILCPFLKS